MAETNDENVSKADFIYWATKWNDIARESYIDKLRAIIVHCDLIPINYLPQCMMKATLNKAGKKLCISGDLQRQKNNLYEILKDSNIRYFIFTTPDIPF